MTTQDLLAVIEEGLENGRISPYLADYIASELVENRSGQKQYDDRVRLDETTEKRERASRKGHYRY